MLLNVESSAPISSKWMGPGEGGYLSLYSTLWFINYAYNKNILWGNALFQLLKKNDWIWIPSVSIDINKISICCCCVSVWLVSINVHTYTIISETHFATPVCELTQQIITTHSMRIPPIHCTHQFTAQRCRLFVHLINCPICHLKCNYPSIWLKCR